MAGQFLDTPISYLKGVGPKRGETLQKEYGIFTFGDLLSYFPFRYVDRTKFYTIAELNADLPFIQLKGKITALEIIPMKGNRSRMKGLFTDGTGTLELAWFTGIKWLRDNIKKDLPYILFGRPSVFNGTIQIAHPELEIYSEDAVRLNTGLQPMYNTSEKSKNQGLDSKSFNRMIKNLFEIFPGQVSENLPPPLLDQFKLVSRDFAIRNIHLPANPEAMMKARFRLKFEELFYGQLRLMLVLGHRKRNSQSFVFPTLDGIFNTFYHNHLPFPLTNAQKRVLKEIRKDLVSGNQMNRLLQGDVGSGKTIVGLMTMLMAINNGFQATLLAPTEILATQHYKGIAELLAQTDVKVELLTGSTKKAARTALHQGLEDGSVHILIGTHAILEDKVKFKNLGLAIIDEQHRFGVAQRASLWKKSQGVPPHILVMTATPIPRTLAMTLYGDLDVSVIDELPPGRKPIQTLHKYDTHRLEIFGFMRREIQKGRQVYVVYPLIEESEKMDYKDLMDGYESIRRAFPEYHVSVVHGKMRAEDKEFEMQRFLKRETQIMVATTVIEVGVNVPNASIMIIESAERFGLSQLHQLRGRVGRGAEQSYCVLVTGFKLSKESKIRMDTMVRTNDGFEIAEVDLQLRGPGDIEGTRQSGEMNFKIADLTKDQQILTVARDAARAILTDDALLEKGEHQILRHHLSTMRKDRTNWAKIS